MLPSRISSRYRGPVTTLLWVALLLLTYNSLRCLHQSFALLWHSNLRNSERSFVNLDKPIVVCTDNGSHSTEELLSNALEQCYMSGSAPIRMLIFSSASPFHTAPHLSDPRSFAERKEIEAILVAALHGIVSHVAWIYPSWLPNAIYGFHTLEQFEVGLAAIRTTNADRRQVSWTTTHGVPHVESITTLCMCAPGDHCTLPLLYSPQVTIPPDACTRNATLVYERVMDIVVESFLLDSNLTKSSLTNLSAFSKSINTVPSSIVMVSSNYFGQEKSRVSVSMPSDATLSRLTEPLLARIQLIYGEFLRSTTPFFDLALEQTMQLVDLVFSLRSSHHALSQFRFGRHVSVNNSQDDLTTVTRPPDASSCVDFEPLMKQLFGYILPAPSLVDHALDLWLWMCELHESEAAPLTQWMPCVSRSLTVVRLCERSEPVQPYIPLIDKERTPLIVGRLDAILRRLRFSYLISDSSTFESSSWYETTCQLVYNISSSSSSSKL